MSTVGVVIPVYRCAPYVRRCLESVIAQTQPVDEIVLVDDCGGDDSLAIATGFLDERGQRFTLVTHPRNRGLGRARNSGLAELSTDLVWFLDSDDWADPRFVEVLTEALERTGADFSVTRTRRVDLSGRLLQIDEHPIPAPLVSGIDYARELVCGRAKAYACTKIFRREALGERPWAEGQAYEDMATSLRVALGARSVAMVDRPLYNYLYRAGSISTALSESTFDLFKVETDMGDLLAGLLVEDGWRRDYAGYRYREVLTPVAHLAMRARHAAGRESDLTRRAIRRVRAGVDLGDIPLLCTSGYYREMIFALAMKCSPALYSGILRWR